MAAPALIVEATLRFLRDHEPFSRMARKDLEFIAERAQLAYFPVGTTIVNPADGMANNLYVIQRGHVARAQHGGGGRRRGPRSRRVLPGGGAGRRARPARAASTRPRTSSATSCRARTSTRFGRPQPPFEGFCAQVLAGVVHHSLGHLRQNFGQRVVEQRTLLEPLRNVVRRSPVFCETGAPIREALEAMRREHLSGIAVVDAAQRPVGIFTQTDLLSRVVLDGVDLAASIASVMTHSPGTIDEMATAQEALAQMAQLGFHQLMVTREGRLVGVVSERDLFALQRVTMRNVLQSTRARA